MLTQLEAGLREAFMAEAHAVDRPASQIARESIRDCIARQHGARAYRDFLQNKVDKARRDVAEGATIPSADGVDRVERLPELGRPGAIA